MRAPVFASLFLLGFLVCVPIEASAQEPQRPDTARAQAPGQEMDRQQETQEMQQHMQQQMSAMMPMMSTMLQNLTQSTMAALAEPRTAQDLAKFIRNYYQALMAQGFTHDEALRIVTSVGLPSLPSM